MYNDVDRTIPDNLIMEFRKDLIRKIKLQRGVHDVFEDKTRRLLTFQKLINVVFTAFITLIVFADFGLIEKLSPKYSGQPAMLTVGVISFIIFTINSIADVLHLSNRNADHLRAIQQYTDLLRSIKKSHFSGHDTATEREILIQLNDRYMQLSSSVFNVGGKNFAKGQAIYLRRRAKRLTRKMYPFACWWTINKKASLREMSELDQ